MDGTNPVPDLLTRVASLVPALESVSVLSVHVDVFSGAEVHVNAHDHAGVQSLVSLLGLTVVDDDPAGPGWVSRRYHRDGVPVALRVHLPVTVLGDSDWQVSA